MRYKLISLLILGLLIFQACSVNRSNTPDKYQQETFDSLKFLEDAISDTPYSALIQYTGDDIISDLKDNVEKHIYHAKVLETYRGQKFENISFYLYCEEGEGLNIDDEPVVITLCNDNEGFYWPGVGAEFEASQEVVREARRISKKYSSAKQQSFPYCK
jgi:hypothetical protein